MNNIRTERAKTNIMMTLISQIVTIVCGLVAPRYFLKAFGSEINGATASITQFLSYITLIEGGIGGIARAALYAPLANGNKKKIESILHSVQLFFNKIGLIFFLYVLFIAIIFKRISSVESLDWISSFTLVIVISLSTFAQYFFGITNAVLLQADQKIYIINLISVCTTILNTLFIVVLVNLKMNVIIVKLFSSFVFILRPLAMSVYVKKKYGINIRNGSSEKYVLKDKWTGLGQHIAYFVHTNTDIAMLTVLSTLENVSVYSVYYLITSNMQSFASSFSSGMEGLFGEMYAKGEKDNLNNTFNMYDSMLSIVGIIILSTTAIMIVPFVKLYTLGINDAEYINPTFALFLALASLFFILRLPYHNMIIAAGHFKQTRMAAYGEAALNIIVSISLIRKFGVVGVAIGTAIATLYRFLYYVFYLSKNIINRSVFIFLRKACLNSALVLMNVICGKYVITNIAIDNYYSWALYSAIMFMSISFITIMVYWLFYRNDINALVKALLQKNR